MDAQTKARLLLSSDIGRMERESDMFLSTVSSFADDELAAPSLSEGWTRGHVVAHVVAAANQFVALADGAVTGVAPAPADPAAADAALQALAAKPAAELTAALSAAIAAWSAKAQELKGELASETVTLTKSGAVPAHSLPKRFTAEVILHHADLDTAWHLDEADPEAILDALEVVAARLGKLGEPAVTIETEEGESWTIGTGGPTVRGFREEILAWAARGQAAPELVVEGGDLPVLPAW